MADVLPAWADLYGAGVPRAWFIQGYTLPACSAVSGSSDGMAAMLTAENIR